MPHLAAVTVRGRDRKPDGMQYLFTRRRRYVGPHRLLEALLPLMQEIVELLDAIEVATGDDRWAEAVEKLAASRRIIAGPSARQRQVVERVREEQRVQDRIRELQHTRRRIERAHPRKPQARVMAAHVSSAPAHHGRRR